MREWFEFRVNEKFAGRLFPPNEGKRLGSTVRKIEIYRDDPRFEQIRQIQAELTAQGDHFFIGWNIKHLYSEAEIKAAELFHLIPTRYFEPEGEEQGTVYDDAKGCQVCGAGAPRIGPLILKTKRIPATADVASSIAFELVVSEDFVEILRAQRVRGVEAEAVFNPGKVLSPSARWRTLNVTTERVRVVPPTVVANGPFEPGPGPCQCGDLLGLNLISELTIEANRRGIDELCLTKQFVGVRRGVVRPRQMIVVSARLRAALVAGRIRGCRFDVAHLA